MPTAGTDDSEATRQLIDQAVRGESSSLAALLERHRDRLRRMVALRLDRRLSGRIDPSDVLQEAFLEAAMRLPEYRQAPPMPFFLWLRLLTGQRLRRLHRQHLGARMRDAGREVALNYGGAPEVTSVALVAHLLAHDTRPSEAAARAERRLRLQEALERMEALDREALALRHFERLTNAEAARTLGLTEAAFSQRHFRALKRLRDVLERMPGGKEGFEP